MRIRLLLILLLFPMTAAANQYRCNGRIQYRPCDQKITATRMNKSSGTAAMMAAQRNAIKASFKYQNEAKNGSPLYADIIKADYQKYPHKKQYGQWKGVVKGNGDIHLSLLINKRGEPEENRYMGHVRLKNDQTSFNFVSSPPKSGQWTWKILAVPK